jgi:hypothetical protein
MFAPLGVPRFTCAPNTRCRLRCSSISSTSRSSSVVRSMLASPCVGRSSSSLAWRAGVSRRSVLLMNSVINHMAKVVIAAQPKVSGEKQSHCQGVSRDRRECGGMRCLGHRGSSWGRECHARFAQQPTARWQARFYGQHDRAACARLWRDHSQQLGDRWTVHVSSRGVPLFDRDVAGGIAQYQSDPPTAPSARRAASSNGGRCESHQPRMRRRRAIVSRKVAPARVPRDRRRRAETMR